ncbi:MAG: HAMP domain-containing histidine kinase [Planctomycetes bacterium]|nr:HAMP domain-containing histidine kinase [Planctomycetota bacterium]
MFSYSTIPEKSSVEKELAERISWFIALRWIIVFGISLVSLFARFIMGIKLPITKLLIICLCVLLLNGIYSGVQKRIKSIELFANVQISVDWIILIFLIHYTGGIESPMIFYFIFHVIISAVLLRRKECYLQTTFSVLLICGLSVLEYAEIVPHVQICELFPMPVYNNGVLIISVLFFTVTTLYVSCYLATSITHHLRKRENEILILKNTVTDAYEKLQAIDKEKNEFTFKVTHELRSPLSAVYSLLKSIEEGYAGEVSQKARDLIVRSEKRIRFLLTLVNDLLDLVAGRSEKPREGEKKQIDINDVVKRSVLLVEEKAKLKDVKFVINSTGTVSYLFMVPDDLDIILSNLIDNSVKYSYKGGTITITNKIVNKEIMIEISDTGIGIHEDDLDKIFNEFYRAENARTVEYEGTGLGLSIVRALVKKYGGNISVTSVFGKGATFVILLPVG